MGRRKIEIQPITNDRNRAVTFTKRKNGLFKKAYELGVLCSVDVAIIIFEEKPGHNRKLYQYCSSDIHEIVQRHLRHDGDTDTRGVADFSGNPIASKLGDAGEGDDDDIDEDGEEEGSIRSGSKRRVHANDPMNTSDLDYIPREHGYLQQSTHPTIEVPPYNSNVHHHQQSQRLHQNQSSIPISHDRFPSSQTEHHQSKKQRLNIISTAPSKYSPAFHEHGHKGYSLHRRPHSGSSSDEHMSLSASPGYTYNGSSFRQPQSAGSQTSYSHDEPHHFSYPQYTPFFPTPSSSRQGPGSPPTPSFIPLTSNFSAPPRGQGSIGPGRPPPTKSPSGGADYERIYATRGGRGKPDDLFAALLNAEEQGKMPTSKRARSSSGFGLDWPIHAATANSGGGREEGGGGGASIRSPSAGGDPGSADRGPVPDWLEFLSGNSSGAHSFPSPGSMSNSQATAPRPPFSSVRSFRDLDTHLESISGNARTLPGGIPISSEGLDMNWQRARRDGGKNREGEITIDDPAADAAITDAAIFGNINVGEVKKEGGAFG